MVNGYLVSQPDISAEIIGQRYMLLDQLGHGGMGTVYRALDRLTDEHVALKRVLTDAESLMFASKSDDTTPALALAQEFKFLSSLRHPNIISVLDYGFDNQERPFFTMELLPKPVNLIQAGEAKQLTDQVGLIIQVLQALTYLHRHGILHRDLKPGNVSVLVPEQQVRVLDFGLSVSRRQETPQGGGIVGTLAYMAPETLLGKAPTEATDLYAVGVMLFELFSKRHPFDTTKSITDLVDQILYQAPNINELDINQELRDVIGTMLTKDPLDRYQRATDVIDALCTATNYPRPPESVAIRESFLQAASLVGREAEVEQLQIALTSTIAGKGSSYLIGGESGVGKSRLIEELRTIALVNGAILLRGQEIAERGTPYQIWRSVLLWLCLLSNPDDLEASVLKTIVPDIGNLLKRPIPDAPDLDPRALQERTFLVIEGLLGRVEKPIVLILEDLHWTGDESLLLINRLNSKVANLPILILGTYRNDERPELPERLPGMNVMRLNRLSDQAVDALSASILGESSTPQIVNWLRTETEGNAFFVVEVLRALAAEVGQLDKIAYTTLPTRVLSGGIQQILQRRLNRVPVNLMPLLEVAAVSGRELDLKVLALVDPTLDFNHWLTECSNAMVLEISDNQWRFAHDKLREALLEQLTPETRKLDHQKVAQAMETAYPDDNGRAALLAYHWREVGNNDKEAHYSAIAGEQALKSGAYQDAVNGLNRAVELYERNPRLDVDIAMIERSLGEAYRGLGKLHDYIQHYEQALKYWRLPVARSPLSLAAGLFTGVFKQTGVRLFRRTPKPKTEAEINRLQNASHAYYQLAEAYYFSNKSFTSLNAGIQGLNAAEQVGESPALAVAYATMSIVLGTVRMRPLAGFYRRRGWQLARKLNDPGSISYLAMNTNVYSIGVGDWQQIRPEIAEGITICEQRGDWRLKGMTQDIIAELNYYEGNFDQAYTLFAELLKVALRSNDIQLKTWGLLGSAKTLLPQGQFARALDFLKEAETIVDKADLISTIRIQGKYALAYLRSGMFEEAIRAVERVQKLTALQPLPNALESMVGYIAPVEVYATLAEFEPDPVKQRKYAQKARGAVRKLHIFALIFEPALPIANRWQGVIDWQSGKQAKALKSWQKSLAHAERLTMRFEAAMAHYEIARHLRDSLAAESLTKVLRIFAEMNVTYFLDKAQEIAEERQG